MKHGVHHVEGPTVYFADGSACAPDVVICATGYRPALAPLAGHLVALDEHGMPPFTGPASSPGHPGLWFFGLDRSIYGNMHIHRRQARQLAQMIARS
jgi:putative flavoprotein involved in K+ transport